MINGPDAENVESLPEAVAEMLALARKNSADALESAWMTAVEGGQTSLDHLVLVLEEVTAQKNLKLVESLLWLVLSMRNEKDGPDAALDVAWRARALLPESDSLRTELASFYRTVHAASHGIETLAAMTILRKDIPLRDGPDLLERLLSLPSGTYVSDSRRKSPGRIMGVDAARKVLTVSFGESERSYDALTVEALEVLPTDDFRAMVLFDQPRLQTLAKDDPSLLVQLALRAYGPRMGLKDLKGHLVDVAVPASGWSKWWSAARTAVKRCPIIEISEGTQPDLYLRPRAITYEAEARDKYDSATTVEEKLLLVIAHLAETGHEPAVEESLLRHFAADLAVRVVKGPLAETLSPLAILAEVRRHTGYADLPALPADLSARLAAEADLPAILSSIWNDSLAQLALTLVREALPEKWTEIYAAAMPTSSQECCERIAADLAAAGRLDLVSGAAETIQKSPLPCIAAVIWLWKSAGEKYPEALGSLSRPQITVRLFQGLNDLALTPPKDKVRQQDLLWQARRAVSAKDFALLKDILDHTDADWAKEIRTAVSRNAGLTDHLRVQVLEVLGHSHPLPAAKALMPWEEDAVYTTPTALEIRRKQYEELTTVKMIEIANRIGVALGHGDISENSEFTSALEERDRMTERASAMQTDLVKARIINRSMAAGDFVNIGTRVSAKRLPGGEPQALTFLGPWDAKTDQGIYYYKAPLAMAFMGKRVGEIVTYETDAGRQEWEIVEIVPAI
jgi:transcription elongation factor GreA